MKLYTIANWSWYNSSPPPIFTSLKKAEQVARMGRELRAYVYVIEM